LQALFAEFDLTADQLRGTFRERLVSHPAREVNQSAAEGKSQMAYDHEVTEILRLARYLARRLGHRESKLCHVLYALTTRDGALGHIERYWNLGPLRPSRVLVKLAEAMDQLDYCKPGGAAGVDVEVRGVLLAAQQTSPDRQGYAAVEFAEFLYTLLDTAEDRYKLLLAECVEQSNEAADETSRPADQSEENHAADDTDNSD